MMNALHYGAMAHMAAFEVMIYFMNQEKELAMQRSLMAGAAVGAVVFFMA
jgi:hypothetical protein